MKGSFLVDAKKAFIQTITITAMIHCISQLRTNANGEQMRKHGDLYEAVTALVMLAGGIVTVVIVALLVMTAVHAKPNCATVRNPVAGTIKCVPLPKPRPKVNHDRKT